MNEIQLERVNVLKEATRRMNESDYQDMKFADTDELVKLLKIQKEWQKKLKSGRILEFIEDAEERTNAEYSNKLIESENQRVKKEYIDPLNFKIKVLEVEIILFNGMFEMSEISNEIYKRVYANSED